MHKYYNLFRINMLQKINCLDKLRTGFVYFLGFWLKHVLPIEFTAYQQKYPHIVMTFCWILDHLL